MKKMLVALALAAFASTSYAAISGSTHDMRTRTGTKGACQYCHAPHLWTASNVGAVAPLWNRNSSGTIVLRASATLSDITRACLSCHDGTTQLGAMVNNPDTGLTAVVPGAASTGLDLTNDHPVDVAFPAAGAYQVPGAAYGITAAGQAMRCTSCHDVHNEVTGATPFFVVNIATTDICGACHTK